ncbi:PTS glucose transporter subunit IIA [Micrococcales bacterium 31B]|nr:PTS glucose transporter subunit IIA [Micrococcales bacterium 31B]
MFKKLFKKDTPAESLLRPCSGGVLTLDSVPDPVFASRTLGDGFAIETETGEIVSPVGGELVLVADTGHAFAVRSDAGAEVLVHIGIDTVTLKGAGFTTHKRVGERVAAGDLIVTCDLDVVRPQVPSLVTIVVITNGTEFTVSAPDLGAVDGPIATVRRA